MAKDGNEEVTLGLGAWWMDKSQAEADMAVEKSREYGSIDLKIMGHAMVEMLGSQGRLGEELPEEFGIEMAIAFYVLGKISRIVAAFNEGRLPNIDSWDDISVYARMAQRVRVTGAWPGDAA